MNALKRFQDLLRDLFQFDMAELDFGLYRLLRLKRDEIEAFITEQLPRQVDEAFSVAADEESADLQTQVEELADQIRENVADDAVTADYRIKDEYRDIEAKIVRELVDKFETTCSRLQSVQTVEADKAEIFNHLYSFFSRYYENGDFIPKRRYGAREAYAVPYDGSEVFFHWANRDQHYVKTSETFKDYAFSVEGDLVSGGDWRVRFVITEATVPKDNVKGDRRFFFPVSGNVEYDAGVRECRIPFEYRPPTPEEIKEFSKTDKAKLPNQRRILKILIPRIVEKITDENLRAAVIADQRTQEEVEAEKPGLPLLLKRMLHYARRNTTDYFIHKNLRRFLLDEFQFYIKDQVLHIEDLEGDFEARRRLIRVLRHLGEKVVCFLSEIEDAQKCLFEKKKFVLETSYLIPVQNIPHSFWPDVLNNSSQISQWKDWFALNPKKDLFNQKGEVNESFLKEHPTLVVDTKLFDSEWTIRLLEALPFDDLDNATDGLMVNGENYQTLRLLLDRYKEQIKLIYIDPPYNTGGDEFIYKDRYQHSCWITMMEERLDVGRQFIKSNGSIMVSIDDIEVQNLKNIIGRIFGDNNFIDTIIWKKRYGGGAKEKYLVTLQEYIIFYSKNESSFENIFIPLDPKSIKKYYKLKDDNYKVRGPYRTHPLEATKSVDVRPNLIFPITAPDKTKIWPERQWWWDKERVETALKNNELEFIKSQKGWAVHTKQYLKNEDGSERLAKAFSIIDNVYTQHGTSEMSHIFGDSRAFAFPKPSALIKQLIRISKSQDNDIVLDYFAGSAPTSHAVINLNREDGCNRKFIVVEIDEHFDSVILPRVAKIIYTPEWKDGKPKRKATAEEARRTPRMVKVLRLESYEDALHNLASPSTQERVRAREKAFKDITGEDEYRLRYLVKLPLEASETMLNLKSLEHPFSYTLEVLTEDGPKRKPVDLIETFNYLYGLRVRRLETWKNDQDKIKIAGNSKKQPREYRIIKATDREQKRHVLVVWRDTTALNPQTERDFLEAKVKEMAQASEVFDEQLINADTVAERFTSLDLLFKRLMMAGEEEAL